MVISLSARRRVWRGWSGPVVMPGRAPEPATGGRVIPQDLILRAMVRRGKLEDGAAHRAAVPQFTPRPAAC